MRRGILLISVISLALLPAVQAGAGPGDSPPLRFDLEMVLEVPPGYWLGDVTGDIEGTYTWVGTAPPVFRGKTWHYQGQFTIVTIGGGSITGYGEGVYNLQPGSKGWSYRANGWVTGASGDYGHLVGYKYHENGVTTAPVPPIHAEGFGFFAKA